MKSSVSSLELGYLVKELELLVGAVINKVYQDGDDFLFDLHKRGSGKMMLRVVLPDALFLTKYKPDYPEPSKYCGFLRKRLSGAMIKGVEQAGFDRIVEIRMDNKQQDYVLIMELFSKGNLLLCDGEKKIISPLKPQSWSSRTLRGGIEYEYPPVQVDPRELSEEEFEKVLGESEMDSVVKALAVKLGLGRVYAEEACRTAGVDKDSNDTKGMYRAVQGLFSRKPDANSRDGETYPFVVGEKGDSYPSFNEAIDEVYSRKLVSEENAETSSKKDAVLAKIRTVVENQEDTIRRLEAGAVENQRKAELLFERYQEVKGLLDSFNADRKALSWDELKEKYEGHDLLKSINEKEGTIVIELQ